MKIRKIKVVTIHGQTFTPKQLKEHHKELAKLDKFDIEEYEKNLPNLSII
jgi:predicted phosphodiesterase|tara:strand:+ start:181 stop:330 length:150 start_codon:yes stop_codon:yes gene_type:complete